MAKGKQTANEPIPKHGSKPLSPAKTKLFAISMVVAVILMSAAIFIPKTKMEETRAAVEQNLEQKYGEEFKITWSTLNKRPLSTTFEGTVQAVESGHVYEFQSNELDVTIDYDRVEQEMKINEDVEATIDGAISLVNVDGDEAVLRILLETKNAPVDDAMMAQLGEDIKAKYNLTSLQVNVYEIVDRAFEAAEQQMTVFQRSLIPMDSFDTYEPVIEKFTF